MLAISENNTLLVHHSHHSSVLTTFLRGLIFRSGALRSENFPLYGIAEKLWLCIIVYYNTCYLRKQHTHTSSPFCPVLGQLHCSPIFLECCIQFPRAQRGLQHRPSTHGIVTIGSSETTRSRTTRSNNVQS